MQEKKSLWAIRKVSKLLQSCDKLKHINWKMKNSINDHRSSNKYHIIGLTHKRKLRSPNYKNWKWHYIVIGIGLLNCSPNTARKILNTGIKMSQIIFAITQRFIKSMHISTFTIICSLLKLLTHIQSYKHVHLYTHLYTSKIVFNNVVIN